MHSSHTDLKIMQALKFGSYVQEHFKPCHKIFQWNVQRSGLCHTNTVIGNGVLS